MVEKELKKIMTKGYDVVIECKGSGRMYEMTYEATARKVLPQNPTNKDVVDIFETYHAVGNNLKETLINLLKNKEKLLKT